VPSDAGSAQEKTERRHGRTLLVVGIVVGVYALDQLSKAWVVAELSDAPLSIIGNDVEFRLARNTGGAFSLFQEFTPILAILATIVAIVLVRALQRTRDPVMLVALALVLAGALGNLTDRMFRSPGFLHGAVVDFVRVGQFPSFNVADSAITIGAVLLVIWGWRYQPEPDEAEGDQPERE
jgi:signal peptidase II